MVSFYLADPHNSFIDSIKKIFEINLTLTFEIFLKYFHLIFGYDIYVSRYLNLFLSNDNPFLPSTCRVVLRVSKGIKLILHKPAPKEAKAVFAKIGNSLVFSLIYKNDRTPILAAVSPNLDKGPIQRAGAIPL